MPKPINRPPRMSRDRKSAVLWIDKRRILLGPWGSAEARYKYDCIIDGAAPTSTINKQVHRVRAALGWAVAEEIVKVRVPLRRATALEATTIA